MLNDPEFLSKAERGFLPEEPDQPTYRLPRPLFVPGENARERHCNGEDDYYRDWPSPSSPNSSRCQEEGLTHQEKASAGILPDDAKAFLNSTPRTKRRATPRERTKVGFAPRQRRWLEHVKVPSLPFAVAPDHGLEANGPHVMAPPIRRDLRTLGSAREPATAASEKPGVSAGRRDGTVHPHFSSEAQHTVSHTRTAKLPRPLILDNTPLPVFRVPEGRRRGLDEMVDSALQTDVRLPVSPRDKAPTKGLRLAKCEVHQSDGDIAALDDQWVPTMPVGADSALWRGSWTRLPERKVIEDDMVQEKERQASDQDEYEGSLGMISQFVRNTKRAQQQRR